VVFSCTKSSKLTGRESISQTLRLSHSHGARPRVHMFKFACSCNRALTDVWVKIDLRSIMLLRDVVYLVMYRIR
jgi:hypothetical protein